MDGDARQRCTRSRVGKIAWEQPVKITYITEWSPHEPSGVLRKIVAQAASWKKMGHDVEILALAPLTNRPPAMSFSQYGRVMGTISHDRMAAARVRGLAYFNKILTVPSILREIANNQPDIIYYRQHGPWYPGLKRILSTAPVVMEVNANLGEVRHWGSLHALVTRFTQKRVWDDVDGFACVSRTIAEEYSALGKPVATIANSMPGPSDSRLPPTTNTHPNFIFVSSLLTGGSSWHGADKLLQLAKHLPDSIFNIVGMDWNDLGWPERPPNVLAHGRLHGDALVEVYRSSDIGLGALAMHRKGQQENSALKPLEYLMYGLPVVLGYRETEDRINNASYTLQIGNYEENVRDNLTRIAEFAKIWRGMRIESDLSYLSADVIERRRMTFLSQFVDRS